MNNFPKVEYPGPDFLKDIHIIRNLIFAIQQVTIMQVLVGVNSGLRGLSRLPHLKNQESNDHEEWRHAVRRLRLSRIITLNG